MPLKFTLITLDEPTSNTDNININNTINNISGKLIDLEAKTLRKTYHKFHPNDKIYYAVPPIPHNKIKNSSSINNIWAEKDGRIHQSVVQVKILPYGTLSLDRVRTYDFTRNCCFNHLITSEEGGKIISCDLHNIMLGNMDEVLDSVASCYEEI